MNKIINEMEQLLLKYKHGNGNDIYEQGKQEKKNESHTFVLNLSERLNLRSSNKLVTFQNLSIYYQWKNIRKIYKNNNFKIIAPAWNDGFKLSNSCYSVSNIQDYIQYLIKKHETITTIPPIHVYINRINKRLVFKIEDGYELGLQTPKIMKLFGSTKIINNQNNKRRV